MGFAHTHALARGRALRSCSNNLGVLQQCPSLTIDSIILFWLHKIPSENFFAYSKSTLKPLVPREAERQRA